jgi:predicted HTH transcriptional regulator
MLLRQLIQQPIMSSKLLVCDPFHMPGENELVKEVVGLANADVDGPRHILFGVNSAGMEGKKIVGIDEDTMADLKKAHRYISELVEPVVSLAFMFDRVNGKLVGALEVDDCGEGPFVVRHDYSDELPSGKDRRR